MIEEQFWEIIHASQENSNDCDQVGELQRILSELPAPEILEFDLIFRQKVAEAYHWDLWGVAYLINGGCSDDGFEYFRCWLISRGEEAYRKILADPQAILEYLSNDEEIECEGLIYASSYAYKDVTSEEMPITQVRQPSEPSGEPWEEDDLASRFPQIAERYL